MQQRLRFLLVGDPVEHSRSPAIHREALQQAGMEGEYGVLRADEHVLAAVVDRLRRGDLDGVNVTMPLKLAALRACDRLTSEASRARSVNSLRSSDGHVEGHSSDFEAFSSIYASTDGGDLHVIGAGGSARAAAAAWTRGPVHVSARDPRRASAIGANRVVAWGEPVEGAVLVNATPLGMRGEALPDGLIQASSWLVDLPYRSAPTPAVELATSLGTPFTDGFEFLARQARASFRWWTGSDIDLEPLVEAARKG